MSLSTDLQNFLKDDIAPAIQDTVLGSNIINQIFLSNPTRFSGKNKQYVVKYQKATNGGSYSGFDLFNTNRQDKTVKMSFEPRWYEQPIVLSGNDLSASKTKEAVFDLMSVESESAAQDMADSVATLLYGDGTGNSNKDFLGLVAGADDGTNVATYGGLSRATYTTIKGTVDSTSYTSGGTPFSLTALDSMIRSCTSGNNRPNLILTTEAIFDICEKLFTAVTVNTNAVPTKSNLFGQGATKGLSAELGYTGLTYKGIPILADEKCTTNYLFVLNTKTWEFAKQDHFSATPIKVQAKDIEGQYDMNTERSYGFSISKLLTPVNQDGLVAHIYLGGNLICKNPRYNGYFSDIQG